MLGISTHGRLIQGIDCSCLTVVEAKRECWENPHRSNCRKQLPPLGRREQKGNGKVTRKQEWEESALHGQGWGLRHGCDSDLRPGEPPQLIQGVLKVAEVEPGWPSAFRGRRQDSQQGILGKAVCSLLAPVSQSGEGKKHKTSTSKEPDAEAYRVHMVRKDSWHGFPTLALPQVDLVLGRAASLLRALGSPSVAGGRN